MKDNDTLQQHNIKDGLTIHLVVRAAQRTTTSASPTTNTSTESSPTRPPGIFHFSIRLSI